MTRPLLSIKTGDPSFAIIFKQNANCEDCDADLYRFAEYITIKDVNDLVIVPDKLPMDLAAILPCGGLRAYSAVVRAKPFIEDKIRNLPSLYELNV